MFLTSSAHQHFWHIPEKIAERCKQYKYYLKQLIKKEYLCILPYCVKKYVFHDFSACKYYFLIMLNVTKCKFLPENVHFKLFN